MAQISSKRTNSSQKKKRREQRERTLFKKFFYGDVGWAHARMIFLLVTAISIAAVSVYLFETSTPIDFWHKLIFPILLLLGIIWICALILQDVLETDTSNIGVILRGFELIGFVSCSIWLESRVVGQGGLSISRYLLAPLAALLGAILIGARYIQDIYDLESYRLALLYLLTSFWGLVYPELTISEGRNQIELDKVNRLDLIGGPGYLTIRPGNAVLLEHLHGSSEVRSTGNYFVPRFKSIITIVNLDDQFSYVPAVSAITKDRIAVAVHDIRLRYRIWPGSQAIDGHASRSLGNPYPFTTESVFNLTYNRDVTTAGSTLWSDIVKGIVVGAITSYITQHQLDQITTPRFEEGDPRAKIREKLFGPDTQNKLQNFGAQLLWCDIGHFEVEDREVLEQRIETWSARWVGNANVTRAYGEAQRIAYQELGRAEAQAEMLISIIHAFDDIELPKEEKDQNIRNVILMRTAQVLDALTTTNMSLPVKSGSFSLPSTSEAPKQEER